MTDKLVELFVVNKSNNPLPSYKTDQASGMDLYADLKGFEEIIVNPGEISLIGTGLAMVIPDGFEGQIRSRSGLSLKNGIIVLNAPGTIDADYRDELGVILINLSKKPFTIKDGDRIAQFVLGVVPKIKWTEVDKLSDISLVNRGGGFGSTGV